MHQAFRTYKLNETGVAKAAKMAEAFDRFLGYLDVHFFTDVEGTITQSREHSILVTKLEEASFIAKKAISIQPRYQAPQS